MLLTLETFGFKFYEKKLTEMEQRTINSRPAMDAVAAYLVSLTEERFQKQGPGWKELSDKWLKFKVSRGLNTRILRMKRIGDTLFKSVTVPGSPGSIMAITNDNIDYGSSLSYARTHQFGNPVKNIPARPYIGATVAQREVISEIIAEYITAPLVRAGTSLPGDVVTGTRKGMPVRGFLEDFSSIGGGQTIRGAGGRFVGVYKD